jgi:ABC-type multidrug transport system fused ATPase/permease subunit
LEKVTNWFNEKSAIMALDLSNNEIKKFENGAFNSLVYLWKLNLSNNKLTNEFFDRLCSNQSTFPFDLEVLELHGNLFTSFPSEFLQKFKMILKARLFNLHVIENLSEFNKFISKNNMMFFTKEDVNQFLFQKNIVKLENESFSFNGNYFSSFELESDYRNFIKGFEFSSIPQTFCVIIGINGTGKTTLLQLIEKLTKLYIEKTNGRNNVSCKYFSSYSGVNPKDDQYFENYFIFNG